MPQDHVRHLMAHHAGQLGLIVDRPQKACVDEHRATGEGESINGWIGDHLECEGESACPGLATARQTLSYAIHILREGRILDHARLLAHLIGAFLAQLNVLFFGKKIEAWMELCRTLRPHQGPEKQDDENFRTALTSHCYLLAVSMLPRSRRSWLCGLLHQAASNKVYDF